VIRVENNGALHIDTWFWICMITGILILLYTFMADALTALPTDIATLSSLKPSQFKWPLYILGFGLVVISLWRMLVGSRKN